MEHQNKFIMFVLFTILILLALSTVYYSGQDQELTESNVDLETSGVTTF